MLRCISMSLLTALGVIVLTCSCDHSQPTPAQPGAITLSAEELAFTAPDAGSLPLTVNAPSYPRLADVPDWVTVTDGKYQDNAITFIFSVKENTSYSGRNATVKVMSKGARDVSFRISQAGAGFIDPGLPDNAAVRRMQELGLGWNLGNQLDAYSGRMPGETAWGNPKATQQTFDKVKAAGFTAVRIPVTWLGKIGPAPAYNIDSAWMTRVREVAEYAHKAGLQAIINTHHDENHGDDHWLNIKDAAGDAALNAQIKEEIAAVWTQIANAFKDCGDWLMFEGFNELNDGGWGWSDDFKKDPSRQCGVLDQWQQTFVDAVRATGGQNATRWLGIGTYAANPEFAKYLTLPADPAGKLMVSVHFYDPFDYTLGDPQYSDWGHTGARGKKATGGDEDHVKAVFGNLYDRYVSQDIPVYVGEFGCSMRSKTDARAWGFYLYYLEFVCKAARSYGLPAFLWDNGAAGYGKERHSYINHGTGDYVGNSKDAIDAMVKGWCTNDPAYTLQTVYESAPVLQ